MRTIAIFDQCGEAPLSFFVSEKNLAHLDKVYVKHTEFPQTLQDELTDILYDENGALKVSLTEDFPVLTGDYNVIVCGFLP